MCVVAGSGAPRSDRPQLDGDVRGLATTIANRCGRKMTNHVSVGVQGACLARTDECSASPYLHYACCILPVIK